VRAKAVIELSLAAQRAIVKATATSLPNEAGGILLGYKRNDRTVVVDVLVLESAQPSFDRYLRDDVAANLRLAEYRSRSGADEVVGYVGEWHSHPSSVGPSSIDRDSTLDTAQSGGHEVALCVYAPWGEQQFHGLIATPGKVWRPLRAAKVDLERELAMQLDPMPPTAVRVNGPVFISYRHNDGEDFAGEVERLLHAAGISVWRDVPDLPPGDTEKRLDEAFASGLSGGVLIVTPDIANSTVVKHRELPRLLGLQADPRFALVIANTVGPDESRLAYGAPDILLGLAPACTLSSMDQVDIRTPNGRIKLVRRLLRHRARQLKTDMSSVPRPLKISTQSRTAPSSIDACVSDLDIRLIPSEAGKIPAALALHDLAVTLPIISDAVLSVGAPAVQFFGGMHLSIAVALGTGFPATKFGKLEVVDLEGSTWTSVADPADPNLHTAVTVDEVSLAGAHEGRARLAVFASLTDAPDTLAFAMLLQSLSTTSVTAVTITTGQGDIDPREAGRIAKEIATAIKFAARAAGASEVHLAFHGPYAMALLIGRLLNTLCSVVYEWARDMDGSAQYFPVLTVEPDVAGGPITAIHL